MLEPYSEKLDRAIRARRALKAGGLTALVGVPVTAGALTGVAAIGAKRDRDYKKKKKANVEKNLGLFARPMTIRRAQAAGRLARVKAGNTRSAARGVWADREEIARNVGQVAAIRGARAAGQAKRYVSANAMPLVVGGSIGGGATMAGMQMSERRKMSKSYVTMSRGASEGLQRLARRSNVLQAMKESADPAVAARGRMLDRRMTAGMKRRAAVQAGQVAPRVSKADAQHSYLAARLSKALTDEGLAAAWRGVKNRGRKVRGGFIRVNADAPVTMSNRTVYRTGDRSITQVGPAPKSSARSGLERQTRWENQVKRMKSNPNPEVALRAQRQEARMLAGARRREAVRTGQEPRRVPLKSKPDRFAL